MAAKQFTLTNIGTSNIVIQSMTFNDPSGVGHTANLLNLGGSSNVTGNATLSYSLIPSAVQTFTVDYYDSGVGVGTYTGNIIIVGSNAIQTISSTVVISPTNTTTTTTTAAPTSTTTTTAAPTTTTTTTAAPTSTTTTTAAPTSTTTTTAARLPVSPFSTFITGLWTVGVPITPIVFTVSGGVPGYTWSLFGFTDPGLSISPASGSSTTLSGTPTGTGGAGLTVNFSVIATDSIGTEGSGAIVGQITP
jgi:hypothetical protein